MPHTTLSRRSSSHLSSFIGGKFTTMRVQKQGFQGQNATKNNKICQNAKKKRLFDKCSLNFYLYLCNEKKK
ncbi:MAG: hypothetical protein ACFNLP_06625, partial [Segatella oulorum]